MSRNIPLICYPDGTARPVKRGKRIKKKNRKYFTVEPHFNEEPAVYNERYYSAQL